MIQRAIVAALFIAAWFVAGVAGCALATIDIGACSHDMVPCRDAGARFIPPSI